MTQPAHDFVRYALQIGAIELLPDGRPLKSGRISPYFFNSGLFNTSASLWELAKAYAEALRSVPVDLVFGPPYKGTILAPAVSLAMRIQHSIEVGYASHRKEVKNHGEGGTLLGHPIEKAMRVAIVDDVMTTGGSIATAAALVKSFGGIPVCCVIGFDRQERGVGETTLSAVQEFTGKTGIPVYAAASLEDLIVVLDEQRTHEPSSSSWTILKRVRAYREQYGALNEPGLA